MLLRVTLFSHVRLRATPQLPLDSKKKNIRFPLHSKGNVCFGRSRHSGGKACRCKRYLVHRFSIDLLCSWQFPTMMNGRDSPGPWWRFVLTELIARRKALLSYLPSGMSRPQSTVSPARELSISSQAHCTVSVSMQYQYCRDILGTILCQLCSKYSICIPPCFPLT